jgi:hypothetical protein
MRKRSTGKSGSKNKEKSGRRSMHSSIMGKCTFHHNGGYDGDVIITLCEDRDDAIPSEFERIVRENRFKGVDKVVLGPYPDQEEGYEETLEVPFSEILGLYACYLRDKAVEYFENTTDEQMLAWEIPLGKCIRRE